MRIKLAFEDLNQEFTKTWFLVPESAELIADITYAISFEGPKGPNS